MDSVIDIRSAETEPWTESGFGFADLPDPPTPGLPDTCQNVDAMVEKEQDCSFYTECVEAKYNCGPDGYPEAYGYKYCSRFLEERHRFEPKA